MSLTIYRDTVSDKEFTAIDQKIRVLQSNAGWYIGQQEPCGVPFSRLSVYYKTREDAVHALETNWEPNQDSLWLLKELKL